MISFIHTGDLHLGLQFKNVSFNKDIAMKRRIELWNTFERIVNRGIEQRVDFLFFAGDLFEEEYFTLGDIQRVRDTLMKAEKVNIILVAGNHDTLNLKSLYNMIEWPKNVTLFNSKKLNKVEFADKNTVIYGYSWNSIENNKDLFNDFQGVDDNKTNILIVHGDLFNKESSYLPLDKNYLHSLGFNYIGLGHIHKPTILSNKMAYCGSPEPLDFGETGEHGIIEGFIDKDNTTIKFIPFSSRIFHEKTIKIDENMGYVDIINKIKQCDENKELKKNLYRIKLEGIVSREIELNIQDMTNSLANEFYYIELIDNTIIDYDLETLEQENKDNIIGYFIKEMKNKDLKDKIIRDALYIGLEALLKGKVGI